MGPPASGDHDLPSLLRKSHIGPVYDHDVRFENRNAEDVHKEALDAALAEHERIRQSALRAYELNELRLEQERLRQHALQEEERVRVEMERAREECRIRDIENKKKQVPVPAPRIKTPPPRAPSPPVQAAQAPRPQAPKPPVEKAASVAQAPPAKLPTSAPKLADLLNNSPAASTKPTFPAQPVSQDTVQHTRPEPAQSPANSAAHSLPHIERYAEIHQILKKLRKTIVDEGKQNLAFKKKTGEMRRTIRASMGQLTGEKGSNKQPMAKIVAVLKESFQVASPGIDPSLFMVIKPEPNQQDVPNNGEQLPMLFIYLLNQFSKAVVAQFVDEAGVSPRAAEPIGIVVASMFSNPELCWRGHSLIDILMAKMRVVCPVLWGIRGSEKTEQGRARLGWKKDEGGDWISEQLHNTRMTGLGAGYAAIALRDFSKSRFQNPWPPWHYWQTMASITSTPPSDASPTQYIVLKAMVENYEQRFFNFYGNAALAALRVALVDFPGRSLEQGAACSALAVLADKLKRDKGLDLRS